MCGEAQRDPRVLLPRLDARQRILDFPDADGAEVGEQAGAVAAAEFRQALCEGSSILLIRGEQVQPATAGLGVVERGLLRCLPSAINNLPAQIGGVTLPDEADHRCRRTRDRDRGGAAAYFLCGDRSVVRSGDTRAVVDRWQREAHDLAEARETLVTLGQDDL